MKTAWLSEIDKSWTLFLDRDGVINHKIENDYVKSVDEFVFLPGVLEGLEMLSNRFGTIVIVTNQQGIGKGLMTEEDLLTVHQYMLSEIMNQQGRIDGVFFCPYLATDKPLCRKPNSGMALEAKQRFPQIQFDRSVILGDSPSDMEFGERLGMKCVRIGHEDEAHVSLPSLFHFAGAISSQ